MPDLTLSQLESHLWEAANILRGPVDAADFKTYVFPLLFFKRICDVYDEEYAAALEESGGDQEYAAFPENHRFQIPDGCHWSDVRERDRERRAGAAERHARDREGQPGHALRHLRRRPVDEQGAAPRRAAARPHRALLAASPLGNQAAQADVLGQAYEYLIKKFADPRTRRRASSTRRARSCG